MGRPGLIRKLRDAVGDGPLLLAVVALSLFGVAMVYSAGQLDIVNPRLTGLWEMQLVWLAMSLAAFALVVNIEVRWFEWVALPAYVISIALLVVTLVIGTGAGTARGVRAWIDVGPIAFQPSQFANLATVLMLGRVLGNRREPPRRLWDVVVPIGVVALPMALVMLQPDLGTAVVFGALLLAALFWAGVPLGYLLIMLSPLAGLFLAFEDWMFAAYMVGLALFLIVYRTYLWEGTLVWMANLSAGAVAVPLWNSLEPYQQARFLVFMDPSVDPRGAGWNVIQSRVAIGSGGLFGKGFTEGTQKRLAFLPEQHTDFIFSVVGEEFGFLLGTLPVLAIFGFILWRLVRIAERTADPFAGIVVFGIFGIWFMHIVVNIGMTVGVMPVTGIPLPFLSYGGSFLLASFVALALAERIAAEQARS